MVKLAWLTVELYKLWDIGLQTAPAFAIFAIQILWMKILYGILNWGLGHATRSVPLIDAALHRGHEVVLATSGGALVYLKNRFPSLLFLDLEEPEIFLARSRNFQGAKLAAQGMFSFFGMRKTRSRVAAFCRDENIDALVSDNHPGVWAAGLPSVYLTHQLNLQGGIWAGLANVVHLHEMQKYTRLVAVDSKAHVLAGNLSVLKRNFPSPFYLGHLSRWMGQSTRPNGARDSLLLLLSGPEPQRTMLEESLAASFRESEKTILIRGTQRPPKAALPTSWEVHHLADEDLLKRCYDRAQMVVCRSGYSTVMELAALKIPAVLVPTPGQGEQEYLARHLAQYQQFEWLAQGALSRDALNKKRALLRDVEGYAPFEAFDSERLFSLFEGE